jgi:hypothetical protein
MTNDKITARAIVPAQPGSYLVQYYEGGDGPDGVRYEPIIAWDIARVEGEYHLARRGETWTTHGVEPLTVYGGVKDDDRNFTAIKRPDGTFDTITWDLGFDTEARLIDEFREGRIERDRVEAARAAPAVVTATERD